jgi:predicted AlkP superfamily pyrophosphatase or phosphodiesterase
MNKPNYKNGSIINLMSSIKKTLGGNHPYNPLSNFEIDKFKDKNIILIVADGLGYEFLTKRQPKSFLNQHMHSKLTSVFPATTACAMTALSIGLPPQQHGLTGWYTYLKEIGSITTVLPFTTRKGFNLKNLDINYEDIFNPESFFEDIGATSIVIKHEDYLHSEFSKVTDKNAISLGYTDFKSFFQRIKEGVEIDKNRKYIWAYWPLIDSLSHEFASDSREVQEHFEEFDKEIEKLSLFLKDKNTVILLTADHGLIDTKEEEKKILLENHPELVDTLTLPLSGEPRVAYCYVRPNRVEDFKNYVNTVLKNVCALYPSEELIKENYFGLYKPHPKLKDRVGDYTLIMKDNYIMKDLVLGEERRIFIGNHGGLSDEEFFVPLISIE